MFRSALLLLAALMLGATTVEDGGAAAGKKASVAPVSQPGSVAGAQSAPASLPAARIEGVDVEALLAGMSLEQKIGQLMFVDFVGTHSTDAIVELISDKHVGGIALFSHNIKNRDQVRRLLDAIHGLDTGGIPPFISVDQEGGNVVRIKDGDAVLPSAMALGATRSVKLAETAGRVVGRDLRALGFTMNLAPVLDVNSNPRNPVIGIRSYGEDPELVADIGVAYIRGLRVAGVIGVAKHFPGHGATKSDSHYGLPSLPYDLAHLRRVELVPFERSIEGGLEALMTAHIALPNIAESPDLPSTLSYRILTEVLRDQMGYDGIVITDGLEMRGIVEKYGLGSAAVQAIQAGADMVLVVWTAERKEEVRQALLQAVQRGEIPESRVDLSVRRILAAKARHHILPSQHFDPPAVSRSDRQVASTIAHLAITLVRNKNDVLPLSAARTPRVLVASSQDVFRRVLEQKLSGAQVRQVPLRWAPNRKRRSVDTDKVLASAATADVVVVGLSNSYYKEMLHALRNRYPDKPVVLVSFGSPYMLGDFPDVDVYVCAYTYQAVAQSAAALTLVGENPPQGKLPVSIPGHYSYGHGLSYPPGAVVPKHSSRLSQRRRARTRTAGTQGGAGSVAH
ncbi:MAG: beta-N-acetylhexosaminidase [Pseudomonadota bacterium]